MVKLNFADNSASYSPIPICIPPDNYVFKEILPQNWYFLNKYICVKRIKKHIGGKHHLIWAPLVERDSKMHTQAIFKTKFPSCIGSTQLIAYCFFILDLNYFLFM